jgi:hypothetical protein
MPTVNEGLLRHGRAVYRLLHPAASSLLYLKDEGGPTIVLDQTPAGACRCSASGQEDGSDGSCGGGGSCCGGSGGGYCDDSGAGSLQRPAPGANDGAAAATGTSAVLEGPGPPKRRRVEAGAQGADGVECSDRAHRLWGPLDAAAARLLASRAWLLRPAAGRWAVSSSRKCWAFGFQVFFTGNLHMGYMAQVLLAGCTV